MFCNQIVDYGDDTGSANVVKLCGNFLIASSIEAIGEAVALSEKNVSLWISLYACSILYWLQFPSSLPLQGVDGKEVIKLLSGTIFDCLIYKGYGQRVSERDHRPGGFSLELGLKDVSLVNQAARDCNTPMPFLSVLLDRFVSAKARGRGGMDWSAIGMCVSENAGIDMKADVDRNQKAVDTGDVYK
jgi:3-hydroxyisobutyrate dehydrogenase-like beta-hydroxyacid dehydrogenase